MSKQYQHIVPQVYLKQFGFVKFNKKWFVSVRNLNKNIWEDREIKKFLGEANLYNLDEYPDNIKMIIENNLNSNIEDRIPKIIKALENATYIHNQLHMALAETTANFLCRGKLVLSWIRDWLTREDFRNFFDLLTTDLFEQAQQNDFVFDRISILSEKEKINSIMVLYTGYVSKILQRASITVLKGDEKYKFFTSDHPVSLLNVGFGEIANEAMEIYFPISPKYLIYFYWSNSKDYQFSPNQVNKKRTITNIDPIHYQYFHKEILPIYANEYIIMPINKIVVDL